MASCSKVTKVSLPKLEGKAKVVLDIDSKYTQIGDNCEVCYDDNFPESDNVPRSETIDLDSASNVGNRRELTVKSEIVQVELEGDSWQNNFEITVNSQENGTTQVGDHSKLFVYGKDQHSSADQKGRGTRGKSRRKARKTTRNEKPKTVTTQPVSEEAVHLYNEFAETVLAVLHPLRDDGKWDLFDDKLNEFRSQLGSDVIWDSLLTLEQAQKMCYQATTNIEQAAEMICDVLKGIRHKDHDPSIKRLIEARGYCYLASIYRHQKDKRLGKAKECVDKALGLLKNTQFQYDEAIANYEKASILLDFSGSGSSRDPGVRECLDNCINLCHEIHRHKKWDFVKKGHYAILKKVMWLLNSNTNGGRKRTISEDYFQEAKRLYMNERQSESRDDVPVSEQLQCLIVDSDTAFRSGFFHEAKEIIQKAISLAMSNKLDEAPASRRLRDIESRIATENTISYDRSLMSEGDESGSSLSSGGDADASS